MKQEDFSISKETIVLKEADYKLALYYDEVGYPHIDWKKYSNDSHGVVEHEYNTVVLENRYMKVTLLHWT